MARRKQPETKEEWKQEISFQLLALARERSLPPKAKMVRYAIVCTLARLNGIEVTQYSDTLDRVIEPQAKPEAPVEVKPDALQNTGGSIFDEMGEE